MVALSLLVPGVPLAHYVNTFLPPNHLPDAFLYQCVENTRTKRDPAQHKRGRAQLSNLAMGAHALDCAADFHLLVRGGRAAARA